MLMGLLIFLVHFWFLVTVTNKMVVNKNNRKAEKLEKKCNKRLSKKKVGPF